MLLILAVATFALGVLADQTGKLRFYTLTAGFVGLTSSVMYVMAASPGYRTAAVVLPVVLITGMASARRIL